MMTKIMQMMSDLDDGDDNINDDKNDDHRDVSSTNSYTELNVTSK